MTLDAGDRRSTAGKPSGAKRELIRGALEELVRTSEPGVMIPSERALAQQFQVARMTVRAAVDSLEAMGLVRRVPGRGAFVQHPMLAAPQVLRSFTEDMALRGLVAGAREFHASFEPAGAYIAEKLGVDTGTDVYTIERVRTADGLPMAIERITLSALRFPGLLDRMRATDSLYDMLAEHYGVHVASAEQAFTISELDADDARRLGTTPGAAAFALTQTSRDLAGKVVEFGRSLYHGDRYVIRTQVSVDRTTGRARRAPAEP
jgi:GntR family transcriptional regulator